MVKIIVIYPELVGELAKRGLTKSAVAKGIGISQRTFYSKLTGRTDFTLSEVNAIHARFFPDMNKDSLFSRVAPLETRRGG